MVTKEERDSTKAFSVCKKLKDNIKKIRSLVIENIPLFEEVFNNEYYKVDMGDEEATWSSFLGQPEILYPRSSVASWFRIKKTLYDEFKIPFEKFSEVKLSKLVIIALYAKDKKHAEELIASAMTLLPNEWKDLENSLKGKPISDDGHIHQFLRYEVCKICGMKKRKHEDTKA